MFRHISLHFFASHQEKCIFNVGLQSFKKIKINRVPRSAFEALKRLKPSPFVLYPGKAISRCSASGSVTCWVCFPGYGYQHVCSRGLESERERERESLSCQRGVGGAHLKHLGSDFACLLTKKCWLAFCFSGTLEKWRNNKPMLKDLSSLSTT